MKKRIRLTLGFLLGALLCLAGCGEQQADQNNGIANTRTEAFATSMLSTTGERAPVFSVIFMLEDSTLVRGELSIKEVLKGVNPDMKVGIVTHDDIVLLEMQDSIHIEDTTGTVRTYENIAQLEDMHEMEKKGDCYLDYQPATAIDRENLDNNPTVNAVRKKSFSSFPFFMVLDGQDSIKLLLARGASPQEGIIQSQATDGE